ncbi:sulfur oxidation c-type cytochrome SoxA [Polynucleobacter kasalickyi]|uniref:L-cysteine S-thiosulfotransferase subunit SoxA n=1 Tax=Polynucleobacter kasalickyi TaxID=1938817 RepID=A0A1W2A362_9BURK|nr:sulfur oxidation c-type cytochrome SoxA [Polynucleobacter kasalickyi]SMC55105.1 sulfur-oxidizing protein SoxA [Polynucleobacter kasalickyi]
MKVFHLLLRRLTFTLLSLSLLIFHQSAPAETRLSGNHFLSAELLNLSKDLTMNPIALWLDQGSQIWQKDCQGCHQDLTQVRQSIVEFPRWKNHQLINLEDQIIQCFAKKQMVGLNTENQDVIALSTFLSDSAKGLKIKLQPPSEVAERKLWQEELNHGAQIYIQRQGRVNLSCTQCHDLNIGKNLRSDVISPAFLTGFPIYRQSWQTMGSMDRRLRACYSGVQAAIPPTGHRDLRALELFLKNRSEGLLWEGPSIRR